MSSSIHGEAPAARPGRKRLVRALIYVIGLYRNMISPLRPPSCRFVPTCSQYAADALTQYGLVRGGWLAVSRLAKCGPWHPGGWDPVPDRCEPAATQGESELLV